MNYYVHTRTRRVVPVEYNVLKTRWVCFWYVYKMSLALSLLPRLFSQSLIRTPHTHSLTQAQRCATLSRSCGRFRFKIRCALRCIQMQCKFVNDSKLNTFMLRTVCFEVFAFSAATVSNKIHSTCGVLAIVSLYLFLFVDVYIVSRYR